jgi:hypothetical protein
LRRGGPLLASALVLAAAIASLFGPEPVQRLVATPWFLAGVVITALAALIAGILAVARHSWSSVLQHVGLTLAVIGIAVNQRGAHNGYLYLEQAAGASNLCLSDDSRRVEELPVSLALDSLGTHTSRGFQPAPVTWVTAAGSGKSALVAYNHPLAFSGRQLLLAGTTEPGYLQEYELAAGQDTYVLQHGQVAEVSPGRDVSSFAYDAAADKVGLQIDTAQHWLSVGDSLVSNGKALKLTQTVFAANAGAVFIVNDVRFRSIIYVGFALMLLGLLPPVFRRESK